jgi:uncharacterized protein
MMTCWGLTSGNAGMIAQVKALALALGLEPHMKQVDLKPLVAWVPNSVLCSLRSHILSHGVDAKSDLLAAPYPDVVISCGRRAAAVAMALRVVAPKTKFIHIQDPKAPAQYFDLVVAMEHDNITGINVIKVPYALHTITPERLQESTSQWAPHFISYAKPHVAVLLGGSTNKYTFSASAMAQLVLSLQKLLQNIEGSLLITPSRRTGDDNITMLRNSFAGNPRVYIYDFVEPNPYMGLLALADTIVVTNDSVNMMSEARATGKPIYILPLSGHDHTKPARLAQKLVHDGVARMFNGKAEQWSYPLVDEMRALAQEVRNRIF